MHASPTRLTALALPLLATLGGCVVYDNNCPDEFPLGDGGGHEEPVAEYWLTPDQAEAGDTFIASLESDMAVDFAAIVDIEFLGDVTVCTSQPRDFELLLTLTVDLDAEPGEIDAVLEYEDGSSVFVDDILTILPAAGGGAGSDGSSDGGSDGGSSDGGSSDGGSSDGGSDGGSSDGGSDGGSSDGGSDGGTSDGSDGSFGGC